MLSVPNGIKGRWLIVTKLHTINFQTSRATIFRVAHRLKESWSTYNNVRMKIAKKMSETFTNYIQIMGRTA